MSQAPKLFTNKPKKAQLKQFQEQHKGKDLASSMPPPPPSSATAAAASYTMGSGSSPPPPPPPKESFARRYRFLWPLLLAVNLAVGGYVLVRTRKKDTSTTVEEGASDPTTPVSTTAATTAPIAEKPLPTIAEPVKLRDPIPVDQQRELFKWILEEKRNVKPKDPEEKKLIDEEKAILKQFIRAKSFPNI
ncbi:hypothetical protein JRO89_XS09G0212300 [Xanthoceras sorbifolium]|uniref:Uncharacterized protein n=1 Tax=Xanthoceras sorbifolium TaxID=99658 RepID=A0ABQ8HM91_9ROSI|nr:hypothetical protein JRO89_XS09G0212300 [Xanthoceras sorbifolium]